MFQANNMTYRRQREQEKQEQRGCAVCVLRKTWMDTMLQAEEAAPDHGMAGRKLKTQNQKKKPTIRKQVRFFIWRYKFYDFVQETKTIDTRLSSCWR